MAQKNYSIAALIHQPLLRKRALLGAAVALVSISIFLLGAGNPGLGYGRSWMIRPLITVTLAGAIGGGSYHFMEFLRQQGGWKKASANILSLLVYIAGLWLGTVLGLDGTLWD